MARDSISEITLHCNANVFYVQSHVLYLKIEYVCFLTKNREYSILVGAGESDVASSSTFGVIVSAKILY